MKALSLTQPWASLVAVGAKRYETRSWYTGHRGRIAIAAAKGFPGHCRELVSTAPFAAALSGAGYRALADVMAECGSIVAVATIVACVRVDGGLPRDLSGLPPPAEHEESFGDYTAGRFAWALADVRRLTRPVPAKGALGLWLLPSDLERAVLDQLDEAAA